LLGRSVVVTRAREQASDLRAVLEELGAEVVELPAISVAPLEFDVPDLSGFGWLVFTSVNGVAAFFDRGLGTEGADARALAPCSVAAIGPGTTAELARRGIAADLVPDRFVAEALLDAFPPPSSEGEGVLIPRAAVARDVLPDGLTRLGYAVTVLPVYETVVGEPDPDELARVRDGRVDAVTFTSSSTVSNLTDLLGAVPSPQPVAIAIGPVTAATAAERGWRVDAEATDHTIPGVVATVLATLTD